MRYGRKIFSFQGRMKRGSFIAHHIGLGLIGAAAGFLGIIGLRIASKAMGFEQGDPVFNIAAIALSVVLGALLIWGLVAMAIKRCRDAGLPKRPVAAVTPAAVFIDHMFLAPKAGEGFTWAFDNFTPAVLVVVGVVYLVLVLTPSAAIKPLARQRVQPSSDDISGLATN